MRSGTSTLPGVPAFAMSGVYKGSLFSREAVETYGAIAFLEKPFSLDALFGTQTIGTPSRWSRAA